MISLRLPAKTGYDEVAIGDNHTYRRIATCLILQEEIDRMPDETDSDKENLKNAIIELIKQYCMDNIYKGFDDDCKGEMLHYSLSDVHQKDMENIMVVIADKEARGDTIYWRDSSRVMYEDYTEPLTVKESTTVYAKGINSVGETILPFGLCHLRSASAAIIRRLLVLTCG